MEIQMTWVYTRHGLYCNAYYVNLYRVLCGEWIESMWDCIQVAGPTCIPYFFATVLIANLVILNLFLALLLSSFADMGGDEEQSDEPDKMKIAFGRISKGISFIKNLPKTIFKRLKRKKVMDAKPLMTNGHVTSNGHYMSNGNHGHLQKNGFAASLPAAITAAPGGKEELMNDFQMKVGQDMDLGKCAFSGVPPYLHQWLSEIFMSGADRRDFQQKSISSHCRYLQGITSKLLLAVKPFRADQLNFVT